LEVIDDAAVEVEVIAEMATGRAKLNVKRAVLIVRRNETNGIGRGFVTDRSRRRRPPIEIKLKSK
jgi:hypothetical protein